MKKYFFLAAALILTVATALTSCSGTDYENAPYREQVTKLEGEMQGKNLILTWVNPSTSTGTAIFEDGTQIAALEQGVATYTVKKAADGSEHSFTVKALYKNGDTQLVSEGVTIKVETTSNTKAAFLLTIDSDDYTQLPDDDESTAATYFDKKFVATGQGKFIHTGDVANLDPETYTVIWVMIDRVGLANNSSAITEIIGQSTVNALKEYVQKGGNLYLTNHASMLATGIGRTPYEVTCFGSGEGGTHTDIWTTINILGFGMGTPYDRSDHEIFMGIDTDNYNGWTQKTIALLGPGSQEDHNCFWIPADIPGRTWGDNADPTTIPNYEAALTCTVLAGWGQVTDYCVGAITEFKPTGNYKGTVLCNGLAAYEWHQGAPQDGTENKYQTNIEKLTTNSINYLK